MQQLARASTLVAVRWLRTLERRELAQTDAGEDRRHSRAASTTPRRPQARSSATDARRRSPGPDPPPFCVESTEEPPVDQAGRPRPPGDTEPNDEYRLTPGTLMIEALAAWAILPRGHSGHHLGELLRRWRGFVREADVALVRLLIESRDLGNQPATNFLDTLDKLGLWRAIANSSPADDAIEIVGVGESASAITDSSVSIASPVASRASSPSVCPSPSRRLARFRDPGGLPAPSCCPPLGTAANAATEIV